MVTSRYRENESSQKTTFHLAESVFGAKHFKRAEAAASAITRGKLSRNRGRAPKNEKARARAGLLLETGYLKE
jgi:hypothetical protein